RPARAWGWRRTTPASRGPVDPDTLFLDVSANSVGLKWFRWPIGVGRTCRRLDWRRRGRWRRRGPRPLSDGEAQNDHRSPHGRVVRDPPAERTVPGCVVGALRIHETEWVVARVGEDIQASIDAYRIRAPPP